MLTKNNKGISEIVVTIIIILLAIVVFAVVSLIVRGTVTKGAENIELSANCLEVEMHAEKIVKALDGNQQFVGYDVTVSRSGAGEDVNGVKLLVEEGETRVSSDNIIEAIKPLDKKKYLVSASGIPFESAKVTVIPFFMKKSGDVFYCDESASTDELQVTA